ncbi:hypothetical protein BAY61_00170 [Prauserella marina]|uniref:Uncharacterized protein n=1 Tax=Prauserella marina TaxID=530584 RepID=A0A222VIT1_9PSEU|nr:DUF2020 domain-containing protein [Prauserella marina]ASR33663.1 hypothetical protein BAY61_00170 [Prauserella marina]PWV82209.1 uncharacterized protein DUF3558 [Prauserella marina]SDD21653.1 Protein of unknown function [Prauserella marina]
MGRLLVLGVVSAALLAGCSSATESQEPPPSASTAATTPALPPEPEPSADQPCPYLDTDFVSRANGQMVDKVSTSADTPHPTCFFYRPDGGLQLTVRVYSGDPAVATGLVDQAAPVDTSNPTEQPAGWSGGYEATDDGAVYAVVKEGDAVIVTTNQGQSVKARKVALEAITGLGI